MQAPVSPGQTATAAPPFTRRWTTRRVILATLAVVGVIGGFYLLYLFSNVIFVLFVAAVLATAMRPAVLWLERRHVPQWGSVLLIYFAVALLAAGVGALLAPLLLSQTTQIVQDVPQYYQEARGELGKSNSELLKRIGNSLPQQLDLRAITGTTRQQAAASGDQPSVVSQGVGYLGSFIWALFGIVAVSLIAYFWTLDREKIVQAALLIVPIDNRAAARDIWDTAELKVGAYVRGQALLMLAIGTLCGIAFFFIGLESALLLAVLAGIFEALPYIGPILTAIVAIFVTLAESPDKIWWVVGAIVAIQQLENAILVPRIMDAAVGVNAIVTLLAFTAFGSLFGVVGAILAIPLAAIIQVLLDRWVLYRDDQGMGAIEGRDKTAVIRYQAQDLAQDLRERLRSRSSDQSLGVDSFEERVEAVVGEIDELLVQLTTPASPEATSTPRGQIA